MEKTGVGSFEGSWHKIHKCFVFLRLRSHIREKAWNCVADQWMHLRFKLSDKKVTDDWWVAAEWLLIISPEKASRFIQVVRYTKIKFYFAEFYYSRLWCNHDGFLNCIHITNLFSMMGILAFLVSLYYQLKL